SASSSSLMNSPLPPTLASETFASRSPEVLMTTSSAAIPACSRSRAVCPLCTSASGLPRVPMRSGRASGLVVAIQSFACFGRLEGKQAVHHLGDLARLDVVLQRQLLQDGQRRVQDLVHDRLGHRLERAALVRLELAQRRQRALELGAADAVELAAQRDD